MIKEKLTIKQPLASIINYAFQTFLVIYLLLLLLQQIDLSWIKITLNINYLLVIVLILGILDVFSEHQKPKEAKISWKDYAFISVLGILSIVIIKFKTGELGWISWLISIIAGVLVFLLSLLILDENEDDEEEVKNNRQNKEGKYIDTLKRLGTFKFLFVASALAIVSLSLISFIVSLTSLSFAESTRIVFGSFYALFLPGFIISYVFFPSREIDWIERIALSFALSIAIVPLTVFYLNLVGIKINLLNSLLEILAIIIISSIILYIKAKKTDSRIKVH